jgi:hypothetical protein
MPKTAPRVDSPNLDYRPYRHPDPLVMLEDARRWALVQLYPGMARQRSRESIQSITPRKATRVRFGNER